MPTLPAICNVRKIPEKGLHLLPFAPRSTQSLRKDLLVSAGEGAKGKWEICIGQGSSLQSIWCPLPTLPSPSHLPHHPWEPFRASTSDCSRNRALWLAFWVQSHSPPLPWLPPSLMSMKAQLVSQFIRWAGDSFFPSALLALCRLLLLPQLLSSLPANAKKCSRCAD